jgi:hypothetical protein
LGVYGMNTETIGFLPRRVPPTISPDADGMTGKRPVKLAVRKPEQDQADDRNQDAEAWNMERKIAIRRRVGKPGPYSIVHRINHPPDDAGRRDRTQRDRGDATNEAAG